MLYFSACGILCCIVLCLEFFVMFFRVCNFVLYFSESGILCYIFLRVEFSLDFFVCGI